MRTKLQFGEEVALIVKRHWFVLIKPVLVFLCTFLLPFLGKYNLVGFGPLIKNSFWYVLLGTGVYLLIALLNRKYDIWVVTNRRLIDEWGIITHNSKENSLDKINDIEIKQSIPGRIFNFADISVQTAAEKGETAESFVEKPKLLKETIIIQKEKMLCKDEVHARPTEACSNMVQPSSYTLFLDDNIRPPYTVTCPCCKSQIMIGSASSVVAAPMPTLGEERPPVLETEYHEDEKPATKAPFPSGEQKQEYQAPVLNPKGWDR